jgi:formylmethanofuran dehydrogenase subunit E
MRTLVVVAIVALCSCAHTEPAHTDGHRLAHDVSSNDSAALRAIAAVHGGAGPWAVAGYRMAQRALQLLDLRPGSFDLEVRHYTPLDVQYSCIADGAAAATGASIGKLNLALEEVPRAELRTVYRRRSNGRSLTLRVTDVFAARFLNVPADRLASAGREVLHLRDDEIFDVVP